jgi:hypothetical protein
MHPDTAMGSPVSDPWIERLARLFRHHPAWRQAASFIDRRATSNVFFTHRPGEAWHLERRGDETLLLAGAARDPDFAFRFPPAAIARLEAVCGDAGDFAAELFDLMLAEDRETRVDLRILAGFTQLIRRGYVRLLLAAGPRVRAMGAAHGILGVEALAQLVARLRTSQQPWESAAEASLPASSSNPRPGDRRIRAVKREGRTRGRRRDRSS